MHMNHCSSGSRKEFAPNHIRLRWKPSHACSVQECADVQLGVTWFQGRPKKTVAHVEPNPVSANHR